MFCVYSSFSTTTSTTTTLSLSLLCIITITITTITRTTIGGEYDYFTCDHYFGYPTDVCWPYTSITETLYTCNGTNTMRKREYSFGDCGESDSTPTTDKFLDLTSENWIDEAQCGTGKSCDYWAPFCDGILAQDPLTVNECYSENTYSYIKKCDDSKVITYTYEDSTNCEGSATKTVKDWSEDYTDDCHTYVCTDNSGSYSIFNSNLNNILLISMVTMFWIGFN